METQLHSDTRRDKISTVRNFENGDQLGLGLGATTVRFWQKKLCTYFTIFYHVLKNVCVWVVHAHSSWPFNNSRDVDFLNWSPHERGAAACSFLRSPEGYSSTNDLAGWRPWVGIPQLMTTAHPSCWQHIHIILIPKVVGLSCMPITLQVDLCINYITKYLLYTIIMHACTMSMLYYPSLAAFASHRSTMQPYLR